MSLKTFRCPNCNEMINTSMEQCRYCSAPVNREAATAAAIAMEKINAACSDASYARIAAGGIPLFFLLSFVPFAGMVGYYGSLALLFIVAVLLIRWYALYKGVLGVSEPDMKQAKRNTLMSFEIWAGMSVVIIGWSIVTGMVT